MRSFVLLLTLLCAVAGANAQSLKSKKQFSAVLPRDAAEAPSIITITDSLYDNLHLEDLGLERDVFFQAYKGYLYLISKNKLRNTDVLTIADFSQSCNNKRLYVIDLVNVEVLYQTYVSHGKNSGDEYAESFSNEKDSNKSSCGFLVTGEEYVGGFGTALKLDGAENGINDNVRMRDIVFHGSDFVNEQRIKTAGRIARSLGCPAVPMKDCLPIIRQIKGASCFFIFSPDRDYAKQSKIINSKIYGPTMATARLDADTNKKVVSDTDSKKNIETTTTVQPNSEYSL